MVEIFCSNFFRAWWVLLGLALMSLSGEPQLVNSTSAKRATATATVVFVSAMRLRKDLSLLDLSSLMNTKLYNNRPQTKLWGGNVFIGVCLSTEEGGMSPVMTTRCHWVVGMSSGRYHRSHDIPTALWTWDLGYSHQYWNLVTVTKILSVLPFSSVLPNILLLINNNCYTCHLIFVYLSWTLYYRFN